MHQSHLAVAKTRLAPPLSLLDTNGSFQGKKKKEGSNAQDPVGLDEVLGGGRRGPFGKWKVGRQLNTGALSAPPALTRIPRVCDCNCG